MSLIDNSDNENTSARGADCHGFVKSGEGRRRICDVRPTVEAAKKSPSRQKKGGIKLPISPKMAAEAKV
jgi:hypothetical protein